VSDFDGAIEFLLENEGGLIEDPNDAGGITNFGISLRFVRDLAPEKLRRYGIFDPVNDVTIRMLTLDQAKFIYRGEFWYVVDFEKIKYQSVCNYIFDMACNMGISQSIKIVQRSLWAVFFNRGVAKDDGILGNDTLIRLNLLEPKEILTVLAASRASFCRLLAERYPKQKKFLNGWLDRCYKIQ